MAAWQQAPIVGTGAAPGASGTPAWQRAPVQMTPAEDIARSVGSGLVGGTAAIPGMFGDVQKGVIEPVGEALFGPARDWVGSLFGQSPESMAKAQADVRGWRLPTTQDVLGAIPYAKEAAAYEPQTLAGRYAKTGASFVPGAVAFGGGRTIADLARSALTYGVIPGLTSEGAGQLTAGTPLEPWARAGGAIAAGGVGAVMSRPSTAAQSLQRRLPQTMTAGDIAQARSLIEDAQRRGIALTWPEALAQVTGGRVDLTDVQRYVEQSRGGRPVMTDFMAQRPAQAEAAIAGMEQPMMGGAPVAEPTRAGLNIREAATGQLDETRQRINALTQSFYDASRMTQIDDVAWAGLLQDPLFRQAVEMVRNDPVRSRNVLGLPSNTVGYLNEVKQVMDDLAGGARQGGQNLAAGTYGEVGRNARTAATDASPDYRMALDIQAAGRERLLDPLEAGPLGKMAATDDLGTQTRALLPGSPLTGGANEVARTVRLLARDDPAAASQLVWSHVRQVFDEATRSLTSGPNQWGAGKFVSALRGNRQQAANLEAAVRALPSGDARWQGLHELLRIMEATGRRQRPGSPTQPNLALAEEMTGGRLPGQAAALIVSPGRAATFVADFYKQWRLGRNTDELARIITDPNAGPLFQRLLDARGVEQARTAAALIYLGTNPGARLVPPGPNK